MLHFLSPEALYGLLLVTTFASVGLLGLWAATSRWHPFLRTAIVLAILSLLLLRPMYEPFVMLVSQVATIAAGVAVYRWFKNRKQNAATEAKHTRYQFSLKTVLFVLTIAAISAAIYANLPQLGLENWLGIITAGILAGVGTLLTVYVISGERWWRRSLAGFVAIALMSIAIGPPWLAMVMQLDSFGYAGPSGPTVVAVSSMLASLYIFVLVMAIAAWRNSTLTSNRVDHRWHIASALAISLTVMIVVLPAYFTWQLINPPPRPPLNEMVPNAYHELIAIALIFERSPLWTAYVADPPNKNDIAREIVNQSDRFELLHEVLGEPSIIPDPASAYENLDELGMRRTLARVIAARAEMNRDADNIDDSLRDNVDLLRLAHAFQGGLIVDFLTNTAIEGMGVQGIYQLADRFDAAQCGSAIEALLDYDASREPADAIAFRDRQYEENAYGWSGQLFAILHRISSQGFSHTESVLHVPYARYQTVLRLVAVDLALRSYQLQNGSFPDSLDQLVPDILPKVPRDPFDSSGGTLRYKKSVEGYLLYSVGENQVDDGGSRPTPQDRTTLKLGELIRHRDDGDLRLDHHFADP